MCGRSGISHSKQPPLLEHCGFSLCGLPIQQRRRPGSYGAEQRTVFPPEGLVPLRRWQKQLPHVGGCFLPISQEVTTSPRWQSASLRVSAWLPLPAARGRIAPLGVLAATAWAASLAASAHETLTAPPVLSAQRSGNDRPGGSRPLPRHHARVHARLPTGIVTMRLTVTRVQTNVPIDDSLFARPRRAPAGDAGTGVGD